MSKKPHILQDKATFKHNTAQRAFTISGITNIDRLSDFQNSLALAMLKGQSFFEWKKANASLIQSWEGADPKRLKKIYAHNIKTAYARGRKMEMEMEMVSRPPFTSGASYDELNPKGSKSVGQYDDELYFRFSCVLDSATRPTHRALHGVILPRNHPFWENHTPPLDWGCRCRIDIFDSDHLKEKALIPNSTPPISTIDNPFAFGSTNEELAHIINTKLKAHSQNKNASSSLKAMQKEIERREERFKSLNRLWNAQKREAMKLCQVQGGVAHIFGENKALYISQDIIHRHKNKHKEIDAFDYSLIPYMLEHIDSAFTDPKDERYLILVSKKFGRFYRLALKHIKDKNEIWVSSLLASNSLENLSGFLKNKKRIL